MLAAAAATAVALYILVCLWLSRGVSSPCWWNPPKRKWYDHEWWMVLRHVCMATIDNGRLLAVPQTQAVHQNEASLNSQEVEVIVMCCTILSCALPYDFCSMFFSERLFCFINVWLWGMCMHVWFSLFVSFLMMLFYWAVYCCCLCMSILADFFLSFIKPRTVSTRRLHCGLWIPP